MNTRKNFVLDTNILIENPEAIFGFADNCVIITETTLEELDGLKKAPGDTGYNARQAIRLISSLRDKGDYKEGVPLNNGGILFVRGSSGQTDFDPKMNNKPDNRILSAAMDVQDAILVTNDIAMQVKGSVKGLQVQDYRNMRVEDTDYEGRTVIETDRWDIINQMYTNGEVADTEEMLLKDALNHGFVENEYILLKGCNSTIRCQYRSGSLRNIDSSDYRNNTSPMSVTPKNHAQRFAIHALTAPAEEIPLVILKGPAGCAKTFLSLAAGLDQTLDNIYTKVVITRGNVLADKELGFLKGDLEDKMNPLLAPFYDNLEVILRGKHGKEEDASLIQAQIEELKETGKIEIASLAYMRGRSLANAFVIVDEVQNITPGQVLTIVTRMAEGAKLVLCGDPDQIDAPNLDKHNNGLAFVSERMRGSSLCSQIAFHHEESVRSPLSVEAAKRLNIHTNF